MRTSARIAVAGIVSVLALALVPASSTESAQAGPNYVHCCGG